MSMGAYVWLEEVEKSIGAKSKYLNPESSNLEAQMEDGVV